MQFNMLWRVMRANNLNVNPAKYPEIIFVNKRQKFATQLPPPIQNIARVKVINILDVTFTNSLSVAEHLQSVINSCTNSVCFENPAVSRHG